MLDWLKDSRHPIVWILVIYPHLIILLYLFYFSKLQRMVKDLPLVMEEPVDAREESSTAKETSLLDDGIVSQCSIDNLKKSTLEASLDDETATQIPPVIAERQCITATDTSRQSTGKLWGTALIFSIQLLLAHRVGVLAVRHMRQTQGAGKLIGILGTTIVTILVSLAMGFIMNARSSQLRGYRTADLSRAPTDTSDPLSRFLFYSWLSLLIPCIRCALQLVG